MERAAHEKRRDKETGRLKKKQRLRTSQDVYNRIMWDTGRYDPASFVIGYLDRFDGMMEIALDEFVPIDKGGDIAYHRVYYFRQGDVVVWDRNKRIDNVFGSGDTAAAAAAAATTTTTTTTSSDDSASSSSASEEDEGEDQPTAAPATTEQLAPSKQPIQNESMPKMRSCGFLLFADVAGSRHFLLMKHGRRYDLPKGHVESGETDRECALREVQEETGIEADAIHVDSRFSYAETYYPVYKRLGGKTVEKTLRIFIGHINDTAARDPTGFPVVRRTEHGAHEWVKWNPPHHIQKNTIDPLLKTANEHFKQLKEEEREKAARKLEQGDDNDDDDDDDDGDEVDIDAELLRTQETSEVAEAGTVERTAEKEKLEKERMEKAEKERMERELKVRRRTDYNARKTRRQRNAMVSGGGYALLDKVRDETGRGQVGIYEDDITFDESALNAQAKLILKRNDRANRRLDENVHNYTGDDDSDDDEISDEEAAQYVVSRSPKGKLGEFLDLAPSDVGGAEEDDDDVAAAIALSATTTTLTTTSSSSSPSGEEEWSCQACTYVNKPTFLCCEVCASQRS